MLNKITKSCLLLLVVNLFATSAFAFSEDTKSGKANFFNTNIDYELHAHFSIGGSAPLGMPSEIKKIESYDPDLQLGLGIQTTKWFDKNNNLGVRLGVSVHSKGMKTGAQVKDYLTEVMYDKLTVRGVFTGFVETNVNNTYLTLPLSAVYKLSDRWALYGGPYVSFLINRDFSGYVSDGYLRQGDVTGDKITFEGDSRAAYDFSDSINKTQWGVQLGGQWAMRKHLILFSHLEYDINGLFQKDFSTISFSLHNIYLNFGFGYRF